MASLSYVASRPLVFVDTETGGLDPATDALLSLAAIRTDCMAGKVLGEMDVKVTPYPFLLIHARAAEVNGYTPEHWAGASSEAIELARFAELAAGAVWVGHSPAFDIGFLQAAFARHSLPWPKLGYRYPIDTAVLAWPLLRAGRVDDLKLQTIRAALAVYPAGEAHTAGADARTCLEIYKNLVGRYVSMVKPTSST